MNEYEDITERCEYSSIKIDDVRISSVYKSPNSSFDVLKQHIDEVITVSKRFCHSIIDVGDFSIKLKIETNYKFIECMEAFTFTLINKYNKSLTDAKTQTDYSFTNVNDLKSDYFVNLTRVFINQYG